MVMFFLAAALVIANLIVYFSGILRTIEKNGEDHTQYLNGFKMMVAIARYLSICRSQGRFPVWAVVMAGILVAFIAIFVV